MSNTRIFFVLDKTGSMRSEPVYANTIAGFNEWLRSMKTDLPEASFTLITFNSLKTEVVHRDLRFSDVPDLTPETYICDGWTPLFEAICKTIEAAEKVASPDDKVVITILTDGQENCSPEPFTQAYVAQKVKEKQDAGWQFIFLGANMDAYTQGRDAAISRVGTMSYDSRDWGHTQSAFRSAARNTASYATGASGQAMFSNEDRDAAGDQYSGKDEKEEEKPKGFVNIDL